MTKQPLAARIAAAIAALVVGVVAVMVATPALSSLRGAPSGDYPLSVRKNIKDLSSREKAEIVDAIKKAKATPSPWDPSISYYDQFVYSSLPSA